MFPTKCVPHCALILMAMTCTTYPMANNAPHNIQEVYQQGLSEYYHATQAYKNAGLTPPVYLVRNPASHFPVLSFTLPSIMATVGSFIGGFFGWIIGRQVGYGTKRESEIRGREIDGWYKKLCKRVDRQYHTLIATGLNKYSNEWNPGWFTFFRYDNRPQEYVRMLQNVEDECDAEMAGAAYHSHRVVGNSPEGNSPEYVKAMQRCKQYRNVRSLVTQHKNDVQNLQEVQNYRDSYLRERKQKGDKIIRKKKPNRYSFDIMDPAEYHVDYVGRSTPEKWVGGSFGACIGGSFGLLVGTSIISCLQTIQE